MALVAAAAIGVEGQPGTLPANVHAGIEIADFLRVDRDEVVVERCVVELDDGARAGCGGGETEHAAALGAGVNVAAAGVIAIAVIERFGGSPALMVTNCWPPLVP